MKFTASKTLSDPPDFGLGNLQAIEKKDLIDMIKRMITSNRNKKLKLKWGDH
jgi:hypothetical protein